MEIDDEEEGEVTPPSDNTSDTTMLNSKLVLCASDQSTVVDYKLYKIFWGIQVFYYHSVSDICYAILACNLRVISYK
jgi:hypothetical protein